MNLTGQWIGRYHEPVPGKLIADVDYMGGSYIVYAALNPDDRAIPAISATFILPPQPNHFIVDKVQLFLINPNTSDVDFDGVVKQNFPKLSFPASATIQGWWSDTSFHMEWTTDLGVKGSTTLPRTRSGEPSEYDATRTGWDQFKALVGEYESRKYIFRGQSKQWRLRTTFHRKGRANTIRFRGEDIPALQRHLSGLTKHFFDLSVPDQYGAFLNLVQHHGYPTPLLDWTYYPYVAAFFAYREVTKDRIEKATEFDCVRIAIFDQRSWKQAYRQHIQLTASREHFSLLDPLGMDNPRMIPQQAIVSVTNVDDIETYVRDCEIASNKSFLKMIDLPVTSRDNVMRELGLMGVTAGSLFPGIDGACEELRERNFTA